MLKGKTALVTGASRGIGKAIALKLAAEGANVVINYGQNREEAAKTAAEIEALGVRALIVQADVSSFVQAKELVDRAKQEFNTLDILVNNAGITRDGLLMRMSEQDFDQVIEVNLKGIFNVTRQVVPLMVKQRSGRIINITSVVGLLGNPGQTNYAASKAGIIGFTKALAKEIGSRGITVNAVAPGFIETAMTAALPEKTVEAIKENITLKKLGKPQNVADAVYFLASDLGEYITGQVLSVDGGMAY
ncbi:MAG: 3-oxoacyl-[acyl-carrier-protein] reductase [Peptococcaceae bacterium]|jgi:3-oxoacyl-[acyl-carrier protein] reductase|nr:3-oxoacyl-[acyl-carrier-protein] reductase [Peptococcaceae bacterium]